MRSSRVALSMLVASTLVAATIALTAATPDKSTSAKAKMIARGEYLATVMNCNDCHTPGSMYGAPDFSRKLSGSELGWKGPWGVTYPRNLTPDMETGIGKWSEQDIAKALRTGMRPDGSIIQPPMPWPNFTKLTDEDVAALAAYLKSIPAVSHKVPDRAPPDQEVAGSVITMPPPPAWDAPRQSSEAAMPPGKNGK